MNTPDAAVGAGYAANGRVCRDPAGQARLRQVAEEQAALRRVATLVARATPPHEVFATVAAEAGRLLGAETALSIRYDSPDSVTVVGAWTSNGAASPLPVGSQLPLGGNNVTTLVYQTGRPARMNHADMPGTIGEASARDGSRRVAVGVRLVPLSARRASAAAPRLGRSPLIPVGYFRCWGELA